MKLKANLKFTSFEVPELKLLLGAGFVVSVDKEIIVLKELTYEGFHIVPRHAQWHMTI